MRYRKTRKQKRKQKKILIIGSLSLLLFLCVGYAAFSTNLNIKTKGNIKEQTRVIQSWDENSQTDFHSDFYKQNIVSATFLDNNKVPSNATESWNVSEDKENGEVMAWVIPSSSDNTKYDLYIGAPAGVIANEDSSNIFSNFIGMDSIDFANNFDTSKTIDMGRMFWNCTNLITLDLTSFDTRNVTSMNSMFTMFDSDLNVISENKLTSIKFGEKFKTNNVTTMRSMFAGLTELQTIDISGFDTSNVTDMYHMFYYCESLTSLNLSNFNTSQVTDMSHMFFYCVALTELDLSNFNTSKVTNMSKMFNNNRNLKTLNLCSFDTRNVTDMLEMFRNDSNLSAIYVGSNWSTTKANTTNMFTACKISSVTTGQC